MKLAVRASLNTDQNNKKLYINNYGKDIWSDKTFVWCPIETYRVYITDILIYKQNNVLQQIPQPKQKDKYSNLWTSWVQLVQIQTLNIPIHNYRNWSNMIVQETTCSL